MLCDVVQVMGLDRGGIRVEGWGAGGGGPLWMTAIAVFAEQRALLGPLLGCSGTSKFTSQVTSHARDNCPGAQRLPVH